MAFIWWSLIFWIYYLYIENLNNRQKNQNGQNVAKASINLRYLAVLSFANFYRRFIKSWSRIANWLILILKIILLALAWSSWTRIDKNKLNTDSSNSGSRVSGNKIDDKIANISSSINKLSFRASFFTFKASLAFIQLRKIFIKASILYHFDLEHHIQIEIDVLGDAISGVLS